MDSYMKKLISENVEEADLYIKLASQSILDYTNRKELLDSMDLLVFELARFYKQNESRQGITSRSEGAISETYADNSVSDGVPAFIKSRLDRYKLLHIVKNKE